MLYNVYQNKNKYYLYLTNYKQAFLLDKEEYNILQNKKENYIDIINYYTNKINAIDRYPEGVGDNYIYAIYLCISNTCNAKCEYCFANHGNYGKEKGIMNKEIARKAIDFYMKSVSLDKEIAIIFFGGEPLMAYSIIVDTVQYVENKYSERKHSYHITTNGTLLDEEKINFMVKYNFKIAISIDGGKEVQNKQRPLLNGQDSYYSVTKNLPYLLKCSKSVVARGTYFDFNIELWKCYEDLINLDFNEVNIVPDILDINEKSIVKLIEQLDLLYDYIIDFVKEKETFPFGLLIKRIRKLFLPKIKPRYICGVGTNTIAVDINGDVYPCHRHSSNITTRMGNVNDTNLIKTDFNFGITGEQCFNCWNKYTCTHGCCYEDKQITGSYLNKNKYFCAYSKKLTELSIALCNEISTSKLYSLLKLSNKNPDLI